MNPNKIKPIFKYDAIHAPIPFDQAHCLLTISVGQEVHEGEPFAATVALVHQQFARCTLLIDDTLQRHTLALLHPMLRAEDFVATTQQAGAAWLARNQIVYEQLPQLKIVQWDYWLTHPRYPATFRRVNYLVTQYPAYQQAIHSTIRTFLQRYTPRLSPEILRQFNYARAQELCRDYVLEECTALCLWPELQCHYEIYPSPRNAAMTYTHQQFLLPRYPDLLHPIAIKFKQRKQFKPQRFMSLPPVEPKLT